MADLSQVPAVDLLASLTLPAGPQSASPSFTEEKVTKGYRLIEKNVRGKLFLAFVHHSFARTCRTSEGRHRFSATVESKTAMAAFKFFGTRLRPQFLMLLAVLEYFYIGVQLSSWKFVAV